MDSESDAYMSEAESVDEGSDIDFDSVDENVIAASKKTFSAPKGKLNNKTKAKTNSSVLTSNTTVSGVYPLINASA